MMIHRPSSNRLGFGLDQPNHRRVSSTCTPTMLNMILLILAIITGIQVMIIVYSGRIHSVISNNESRTAGFLPRLDPQDQVSKDIRSHYAIKPTQLDDHVPMNPLLPSSPRSLIEPNTNTNQSSVIEDLPSNTSSTSTSYYYYYYNEANTTTAVEDPQQDFPNFLNSPYPKDEDIPFKIVWLMSFPNSGTSYTMQAVKKYTRLCTATNYAEESEDPSPRPVYEDISPSGPFWVNQLSNFTSLPPPNSYILTKTHCDGYCNANKRCKVSKMHSTIMSLSNFQRGCLGIPIHHQPNNSTNPTQGSSIQSTLPTSYSPSLVFKAIHLVRDPLDNIVSRFHLAYKKLSKADQQIYSRDDVGFQRFCNYWDGWQLSSDDSTSQNKRRKDLLGKSSNTTKGLEIRLAWKQNVTLTLSDVEFVPCWADFFRYVNWHNNAFHVRANMDLPSLILYYEEYEEEGTWNSNMNQILLFLNQTKGNIKGRKGRVHPFKGGKGYHHYFTREQRTTIWELIEKISLPETWRMLQRYKVSNI